MGEKRRSERKPFRGSIHIDELYNQEKIFDDIKTLDVEFFDISRFGVGFTCEQDIPLNCYFNTRIELGNEHDFYAVLKVIRVFEANDRKKYGCEFVGLADILAEYVDEYSGDITIS